jgi:hypothetical protein
METPPCIIALCVHGKLGSNRKQKKLNLKTERGKKPKKKIEKKIIELPEKTEADQTRN